MIKQLYIEIIENYCLLEFLMCVEKDKTLNTTLTVILKVSYISI